MATDRLGPGGRKVVSALLVALLTLGVWWLQSRSGDETYRADGSGDAGLVLPQLDDQLDGQLGGQLDGPPGSPQDGREQPDGEPQDELDPRSGLPWVDLADLPREAAEVMAQIDAGGPFAHPDKDGSTFGNYEGLLPDRARGYYAEYTVPTPGQRDRGARRIVAGDSGERYWTEDHYESFERIRR